jgi:hypothetical protein
VIFRRESLHKKLAREARLEQQPDPGPLDPGPHWGAAGIHGVPRLRRWDAVASAEASGLTGDEVHFVALPDGDLVVDEDEPDGTVEPLAKAIEQTLQPPYRAEGIRQGEDLWAVAALRVQVAQFEADGEELELIVSDAGRELTVDGRREFGSVPELERIGSAEAESYVVRAKRLDADLWEVQAHPL